VDIDPAARWQGVECALDEVGALFEAPVVQDTAEEHGVVASCAHDSKNIFKAMVSTRFLDPVPGNVLGGQLAHDRQVGDRAAQFEYCCARAMANPRAAGDVEQAVHATEVSGPRHGDRRRKREAVHRAGAGRHAPA
jgi:hypothetical protein